MFFVYKIKSTQKKQDAAFNFYENALYYSAKHKKLLKIQLNDVRKIEFETYIDLFQA